MATCIQHFEANVMLNAAHIKNVPGRKLILRMPNGFELLQHGLVRASFIPAVEQRDRGTWCVIELTSLRALQPSPEGFGGSPYRWVVLLDVMGASGRHAEAIVAGQTSPEVIAELAKGRLRNKREQLVQALRDECDPIIVSFWRNCSVK